VPATDPAPVTTGRDAQRRRTRRAIVAAAGEMLADGHTPTVAEIAERAEVSPRTVHVHFTTLEQLLTDAALGVASAHLMEDDLAASRTGDDVEERVVALARAIVRHHNELMHLGRTIIKLTVDAPPPENGGPRRGARRMDWIENALAPARDQLSPDAYDRLASSLAMVIGWEAMLVLWDVLNLTREQAEETTVWAARSLVRAALADE
jgi:AcrR family transcriptional regulator